MRRCTVVIPDAGPFNSLWVAGQLDLLLALDMPVIVVDAVYDEMTGDPEHYQKDREVKGFIDGNKAVFKVCETDIGRTERKRREEGGLTSVGFFTLLPPPCKMLNLVH